MNKNKGSRGKRVKDEIYWGWTNKSWSRERLDEKNIIVTTKVNDSQKDPKDVGNDKNNNTIYFVLPLLFYGINVF